MGSFNGRFVNDQAQTASLKLFACTDKQSLTTNQNAFALPYSVSYPAGSIINVIVNGATISTVLSATKTRAQIVDVLTALNIADSWKLLASLSSNTYCAYSNTNVYQSLEILVAVPVAISGNNIAIDHWGDIWVSQGGINLQYSGNQGSSFTPILNGIVMGVDFFNAKDLAFTRNYNPNISSENRGLLIGSAAAPPLPFPVKSSHSDAFGSSWTSGGTINNSYVRNKYLNQAKEYIAVISGSFVKIDFGGIVTPFNINKGLGLFYTPTKCEYDLDVPFVNYKNKFDQWNDSNDICLAFFDNSGNYSVIYTLDEGLTSFDITDNIYSLLNVANDLKIFTNVETGGKHAIYATDGDKIVKCYVEDYVLGSTWSVILDKTNPLTLFDTMEAIAIDDYVYPTRNAGTINVVVKKGTDYLLFSSLTGGSTFNKTVLPIPSAESIYDAATVGSNLYVLTGTNFYKFI